MRVLALVLAIVLSGCAAASPRDVDADVVGSDLLVWDGSSLATVWVRDGAVIARRAEIVVAAAGGLHAVRFVARKAIAYWKECQDGCPFEGCDYVAPPDPRPPREEPIDELFDVPLAGGPARLLATPTSQEDVTCGIAGTHPRVMGGIEARVSIAWDEGITSSGAPGTFQSPRGVVVDLTTGEPVTLTVPAGFAEAARTALLAGCDDAQDDSQDACFPRDYGVITGPAALRMTPYEWTDGDPSVGLYGLAINDVDGVDYDDTKWLEVEDTLGLGAIPDEAVHIAASTWRGTEAFGFSHVTGTRSARDAALALFRSAPLP